MRACVHACLRMCFLINAKMKTICVPSVILHKTNILIDLCTINTLVCAGACVCVCPLTSVLQRFCAIKHFHYYLLSSVTDP